MNRWILHNNQNLTLFTYFPGYLSPPKLLNQQTPYEVCPKTLEDVCSVMKRIHHSRHSSRTMVTRAVSMSACTTMPDRNADVFPGTIHSLSTDQRFVTPMEMFAFEKQWGMERI